MKREIKFRAWVEKQNYMAYQGDSDLETISSFIYHFGEEILMLGSGLKDKNDKEIFEGDLLGKLIKIDSKKVMSAIPVLWDNEIAMFVIDLSFNKNGTYTEPLCQHYEGMEIIGNIYENKNLLI
jgi:uncharacterized phage protein (TIGR01671 family)